MFWTGFKSRPLPFTRALFKSVRVTCPAMITDAIASFDWAAAPLDEKVERPAALQTTVAPCLGADYPTAVFWGDERRFLYNDAFSAALKRDTPVLGQPAAAV